MNVALALLLLAAADGKPMDHASCPKMAQARKAEVDARHARATGVGAEGVHEFLSDPGGGRIRLEAADPARTDVRDTIRTHLRSVAAGFARGDFSTSEAVHGSLPASVDTLKAHRDDLRWEVVDMPAGGEIRISTRDADALAALHDFLRFQREDHHTGH